MKKLKSNHYTYDVKIPINEVFGLSQLFTT